MIKQVIPYIFSRSFTRIEIRELGHYYAVSIIMGQRVKCVQSNGLEL